MTLKIAFCASFCRTILLCIATNGFFDDGVFNCIKIKPLNLHPTLRNLETYRTKICMIRQKSFITLSDQCPAYMLVFSIRNSAVQIMNVCLLYRSSNHHVLSMRKLLVSWILSCLNVDQKCSRLTTSKKICLRLYREQLKN